LPKFKLTVSEPESGKSKSLEVEGVKAVPFIGKRIGETVEGSVIELSGLTLVITGASDKDGFPLRPNVRGGVKKQTLLSGGVGYNPRVRGLKKRKTVRGNTITDEVVQINLKVAKAQK